MSNNINKIWENTFLPATVTLEDVMNDQNSTDHDEYWYFMDKPDELWDQYEAK
jgi:hypothetical protein